MGNRWLGQLLEGLGQNSGKEENNISSSILEFYLEALLGAIFWSNFLRPTCHSPVSRVRLGFPVASIQRYHRHGCIFQGIIQLRRHSLLLLTLRFSPWPKLHKILSTFNIFWGLKRHYTEVIVLVKKEVFKLISNYIFVAKIRTTFSCD